MFTDFWWWVLGIVSILLSVPMVFTFWLSEDKMISVKVPNGYGIMFFGVLIVSWIIYDWRTAILFLISSMLISGSVGYFMYKDYKKKELRRKLFGKYW